MKILTGVNRLGDQELLVTSTTCAFAGSFPASRACIKGLDFDLCGACKSKQKLLYDIDISQVTHSLV